MAEVLVCGASIMKDVWEIRLKDFRQKARLEDERLRRSALEKINQDWQARMSYKIKTPKRLERKAQSPQGSSLQKFKVKQIKPKRTQGFQSSRVNRQADSVRTTKVNRLDFIRRLTETCPGLKMWTKSWKFSQPSEENKETCCVSDWGKSWKFLNPQPNIEEKPWFDLELDTNNNISSNGILYLWERLGKALDNQHFHQDKAESEWEKSWVFKPKEEKTYRDTTNHICLKCNQFYKLWDYSEWHVSWKSTKPSKDFIRPISNEEQKKVDVQYELPWNTSWMYFKKLLHRSKTTGWSQSWRFSTSIQKEEEKKSNSSQAMINTNALQFNFYNVTMSLSGKIKHAILFHTGDIHSPEWKKSWVTIKNQSEYKEETNKVENTEKNPTEEPKKEVLKTQFQRVKFDILALPFRKKHLDLQGRNKRETNWRDSWKMLKCQRKEHHLRHQRIPHQHPSATLQTSEWVHSIKFTNLTINQDINLWRQDWSTQLRFTRRRDTNFLNENISNNGPLAVRGWGESWRSSRHQHHLERQNSAAANQPVYTQSYMRSVMDWDQSWQSSSNQQRQDRPSMMGWIWSWRLSGDLRPVNKSIDINAGKEVYRTPTLRERFFSEPWNDSWKIKKRSDAPGSLDIVARATLDWDRSWMTHYINLNAKAIQIENTSEWGTSWKISNPQPPKNVALWMHAKPTSFTPQDVLFWTRTKHNHRLLYAYPKEPIQLKPWGGSWRFTKMESNQGFNSPSDESVRNPRTKMRKLKCTNLDKHKPLKRWNDACRLSKSQPQPKRDIRQKPGREERGEMFLGWIESWRFSESHPAKSVSQTDWKNSWKFLLHAFRTLNVPQTNKGW